MILLLLLLIVTVSLGRVKRDMPIPYKDIDNARQKLCAILKDYNEAIVVHEDDEDKPLCISVGTNEDVQYSFTFIRDELMKHGFRVSFLTFREKRQQLVTEPLTYEGYSDDFCIALQERDQLYKYMNC